MSGPLLQSRRAHLVMLALLTLLLALPGLASIPVIDRDEARFAQSSVQMVESGDWVEIRLGDEARNKKPVGAYWAQAGSILATGGLRDRPGQTLWAQRLPSVVAALLAVWLTYLAALPMIGRRGALLAGAMLASALIVINEAHTAKTDALLLATTTAMFAALARLRANRARGMAWLFWGALGLSVLIKGPVGPAVAGLSVLGLIVWERRARWAHPLLNPLAMALALLVTAPWLVAIGLATDGQFFADSLGGDFGGKLGEAAENHGGPPGYYAAFIWITLWPACLFLLPGLLFAWQAARRGGDSLPARGMRLCAAWVVPFWLVLEIAPTKLPHYTLPLLPGLVIAMSGAALAVAGGGAYPRSRSASAVLFVIASAAVLGVVSVVQVAVGRPSLDVLAFGVAGAAGVAALAAAWFATRGRVRTAVVAAALAALPISLLSYGVLIPGVDAARVSQRIAKRAPTPILSPDYDEPSLRYYAGTRGVRGGTDAQWTQWDSWRTGTLVLDREPRGDGVNSTLAEVMARAKADEVCLSGAGTVDGVNYSRGERVDMLLLRQVPCAD